MTSLVYHPHDKPFDTESWSNTLKSALDIDVTQSVLYNINDDIQFADIRIGSIDLAYNNKQVKSHIDLMHYKSVIEATEEFRSIQIMAIQNYNHSFDWCFRKHCIISHSTGSVAFAYNPFVVQLNRITYNMYNSKYGIARGEFTHVITGTTFTMFSCNMPKDSTFKISCDADVSKTIITGNFNAPVPDTFESFQNCCKDLGFTTRCKEGLEKHEGLFISSDLVPSETKVYPEDNEKLMSHDVLCEFDEFISNHKLLSTRLIIRR